MENVIQALTNALNIPVLPLESSSKDECAVYRFYTAIDTGAVQQIRFELRLNTKSLMRAEELKKIVSATLLTIGDQEKLGYNSCQLNGGGQLKDIETDMIQTIMYFTIIKKSEVML